MRGISDLKIVPQGDRELVMTRTFHAQRDLVFEALTNPDLLKRWFLGPPGWELVECIVELKIEGRIRYLWQHNDGRKMGMGGVFKEIVRPEKMVYTENFDQSWYEGQAMMTATLTETNGKTFYKIVCVYESAAALEAVLKTPMESGVKASYDRLAELLESMRQ